MKAHHYLRAVLVAFGFAVAAVMIWLSYGCHGSLTGPQEDCAAEFGCTATVADPPPDAEVFAAMTRARDNLIAEHIPMRKAVNWGAFPRVEFTACYFYVGNGDCNPHGTGGCNGHCAKASTRDDGWTIKVSTFKQSEIVPLIEWEIRNSFLVRGGREDLAS